MTDYILVIDAGTTGTRALVYDANTDIRAQAYTEFPNYNPASNRVEQDADEIWEATQRMIDEVLTSLSISMRDISCIGITNQRATSVVWDRVSGRPVTRAIVWQDTRTAERAEQLKEEWGPRVYARTGWPLAPVYSSLSLEWILGNVEGVRQRADAGELAFGTIDSWLIFCLTGGKSHVISASNASVTGAYDLLANEWYREWLEELDIPLSLFPTVVDDSGTIAVTDEGVMGASVPITGVIADQHAALFAQGCTEPGMVKCTHGTGTFLDMLIGQEPKIDVTSGIVCQIAWRKDGETHYALEGYAACTGAAIQWLRDGLQIIGSSKESEAVAAKVADNGGVYFVPALTGLSAPYWDSFARGTIIGISPGTSRGHIVRATLEGVVYALQDFITAMVDISGYQIKNIAVDGGASANDLLVQFQADQLGVDVVRPRNVEATSFGAALMAGLGANVWPDEADALSISRNSTTFSPKIDQEQRDRQYATWKRAVERSRSWSKP